MVDFLDQGWLNPVIAFCVSVAGSFLGLAFAARATRSKGLFRWQWVALAGLSLGGVGVWSMHYIATLGFSVDGTGVRYDPALTAAGGAVAVAAMVVALALALSSRGTARLLAGGAVAGGGIIAMHYVGRASIQLHGQLHHDPLWVALSCAITVAAATFALWAAARRRGLGSALAASVSMSAAVTAKYYLSSVNTRTSEPTTPTLAPPEGLPALDLLLPTFIALSVFLLICSLFLLLGTEGERRHHARRRPAHRAPSSDTVHRASPNYAPRHGINPAGAEGPGNSAPGAPQPRPGDDVWQPRRR